MSVGKTPEHNPNTSLILSCVFKQARELNADTFLTVLSLLSVDICVSKAPEQRAISSLGEESGCFSTTL